MAIVSKGKELRRLIGAFEREAARFYDLEFRTYYLHKSVPAPDFKFKAENHATTLWQFYGDLIPERLATDILRSDPKWGIAGAELTQMGVLQGEGCKLFVRMAKRAAAIFSKKEKAFITSRVVDEIVKSKKSTEYTPVSRVNGDPVATWLNFLLYHLSLTQSESGEFVAIEPDPFALSLLALERLEEEKQVVKADRSSTKLSDIKFRVAMSFPGEKRAYVSKVTAALTKELGKDSVFYDFDYQAQLARPNLDTLLQGIYRDASDMVVVFLCGDYASKDWCRLEWRAVRDIIKSRGDERIMFVRFDDAHVDGVFSIDGYIDGKVHPPKKTAEFILTRLSELA